MLNLEKLLFKLSQKIKKKIKVSAVMITVDRAPHANYLARSIKALKKSGLLEHPDFDFTLVHSGAIQLNIEEALKVYPQLNIIKSKQIIPTNESVVYAIQIALKTKPDVVLFMEDDVIVCNNFPQFLLDTLKTAGGSTESVIDFATYYDEIMDNYFEGKQFIEMEAKSFYGNQCFAMSSVYATSFANYIDKNKLSKKGFCDIWLADCLASEHKQLTIKCAVPSGAQHIGNNSNYGHNFIEVPCFKDNVEQTKPRRNSDFSYSRDNKNSFIITNTKTNEELNLNSSAYLLFLFCDGKHTFGQIIHSVHAELGGSKYTIGAEIRQGLFSLKSQRLIEY